MLTTDCYANHRFDRKVTSPFGLDHDKAKLDCVVILPQPIYQNFHAFVITTQTPSRKLVSACAAIGGQRLPLHR